MITIWWGNINIIIISLWILFASSTDGMKTINTKKVRCNHRIIVRCNRVFFFVLFKEPLYSGYCQTNERLFIGFQWKLFTDQSYVGHWFSRSGFVQLPTNVNDVWRTSSSDRVELDRLLGVDFTRMLSDDCSKPTYQRFNK